MSSITIPIEFKSLADLIHKFLSDDLVKNHFKGDLYILHEFYKATPMDIYTNPIDEYNITYTNYLEKSIINAFAKEEYVSLLITTFNKDQKKFTSLMTPSTFEWIWNSIGSYTKIQLKTHFTDLYNELLNNIPLFSAVKTEISLGVFKGYTEQFYVRYDAYDTDNKDKFLKLCFLNELYYAIILLDIYYETSKTVELRNEFHDKCTKHATSHSEHYTHILKRSDWKRFFSLIDIHKSVFTGSTLLHYACQLDKPDIIKYLLDQSIQIFDSEGKLIKGDGNKTIFGYSKDPVSLHNILFAHFTEKQDMASLELLSKNVSVEQKITYSLVEL
jgi:hypothetical protein